MSTLLDALRQADDDRRAAVVRSKVNVGALEAENAALKQMLKIILRAVHAGDEGSLEHAMTEMEAIADRLMGERVAH